MAGNEKKRPPNKQERALVSAGRPPAGVVGGVLAQRQSAAGGRGLAEVGGVSLAVVVLVLVQVRAGLEFQIYSNMGFGGKLNLTKIEHESLRVVKGFLARHI